MFKARQNTRTSVNHMWFYVTTRVGPMHSETKVKYFFTNMLKDVGLTMPKIRGTRFSAGKARDDGMRNKVMYR